MPFRLADSKKYLREISVVVLSILIAFALDAWWADRGERAWEHAQLEALRVEFTDNGLDLGRALEIHELVQSRTDSLIKRLQHARPGASLTVADSILAAVLITPTYDPALGTLEALLTSGGLSRIRNQGLVTMLARWPGVVEDVTEDERSVVRHVQTRMVPLLGARVDLARVQALRAAVVQGRIERVGPGHFLPGETQELPADLSIISTLGANLDYHRLASGGLRRLQRLNAQIIETIESELGH